MELFIKFLLGRFGLAFVAIAVMGCFLAAALAGKMHETRRADAQHRAYVAWHDAALTWKANSEGWEASYRGDKKNRAAETRQAREASTAASLACDARVAAARRSAAAIRSIIQTEVPTDADHCPVRPLVGADRLRGALEAPAPDRAH